MVTRRLFRTSEWDALVLGASLLHAAITITGLTLASAPGPGPVVKVSMILLLGLAMNWGSNTVSHIHLHAPLFRGVAANAAFSVYLSVLLAVPQSWWKLRHLDHHGADEAVPPPHRRSLTSRGALELGALLAFLTLFLTRAPLLFTSVYAPGMLLGFVLCAIQGRQEHARSAAGVDVRGRLYNRLWFNDGFHAAHHRLPEAHWTTLPARAEAGDVVSALPPIVRWLERWLGVLPGLVNRLSATCVDALERVALDLPLLRRFLLHTHGRAWVALLTFANRQRIRHVTIVGGGLFPRTALVLAGLLPDARLTIVEAVLEHIARARCFLEPTPARTVRFVEGHFDPQRAWPSADLLVVPLAFRGDRARFYDDPPAPLVAVHDWLWRSRGDRSARVSLVLLKRLNLVIRRDAGTGALAPHGAHVEVEQEQATCGGAATAQPSTPPPVRVSSMS
jgi:hypothetical protein